MKLKNYTTEVPATRSIDLIEKLLVEFGACNIMKEYQDYPHMIGKRCASISFLIEVNGQKLPFKLSANATNLRKWLAKQKPKSSDKWLSEQAERIAWKQQYEILHLQLGQIEMNQLEKLEVFFPYLYDIEKNQTFYQLQKEKGFKALIGNGNN